MQGPGGTVGSTWASASFMSSSSSTGISACRVVGIMAQEVMVWAASAAESQSRVTAASDMMQAQHAVSCRTFALQSGAARRTTRSSLQHISHPLVRRRQ